MVLDVKKDWCCGNSISNAAAQITPHMISSYPFVLYKIGIKLRVNCEPSKGGKNVRFSNQATCFTSELTTHVEDRYANCIFKNYIDYLIEYRQCSFQIDQKTKR